MRFENPKHRMICKLLFAAIIVVAIVLAALVLYAVWERHAVVRGSAGPLFESSPRKDPAPVIMRPLPRP